MTNLEKLAAAYEAADAADIAEKASEEAKAAWVTAEGVERAALEAAKKAEDVECTAYAAADAAHEGAVKARADATAAENTAISEFQRKLIADKPRAGGKHKGNVVREAQQNPKSGVKRMEPSVMDAQKIKQLEAMLRDKKTYPRTMDVLTRLNITHTTFYKYFSPERIKQLRKIGGKPSVKRKGNAARDAQRNTAFRRPRVMDAQKIKQIEAMIRDIETYPRTRDVLAQLNIHPTTFYNYFSPERIKHLRT